MPKMDWTKLSVGVLLGAWLLLGTAGCLHVKYVGQTLGELPETQAVEFYNEEVEPPRGEFHSIGRASLRCDGDISAGEIRDALIAKAREVGADAVKIVAFDHEQVGSMQVATPNSYGGPATVFDALADTRAGGSNVYLDSFGQPVEQPTREQKIFENVVQALFLVKTERFDQAMEKWQAEQQRKMTEEPKTEPLPEDEVEE